MTTPLPTSQIIIPPGVIDLGVGDPPFSLLPLDLIRRAAEARLAQGDPYFLQYGVEQGDGYFREALAKFLSAGYAFPVDPGQLFVTAGVSSGLDLICTLFTRPGDTIFVEEPSYFLALRIFNDHGLQAIPLQTDAEGLVIESLEEKLVEFHPKFLYLIPIHQNPTGRTLTPARRERLAALCREHDFLVVADEVYHFLSYIGKPPRAFAAWSEAGRVISLSSFSKILAPGLRLGWIQAEAEIIRRLAGCGLLDSGGGMNPFASAVVRSLLETGGLEANIARLIKVYTTRLKVMEEALRQHLPEAEYSIPQGGYFFWVRLPGGIDATELLPKALAHKVSFRPGMLFSSQGGLGEYVRLSFVFYEPEQIEQGMRRLRECLEEG